jgi:Immunoglobulin domain
LPSRIYDVRQLRVMISPDDRLSASDDVQGAARREHTAVEVFPVCRWRANVKVIRGLFHCVTFVVITVIHTSTMAAASAKAASEDARSHASGPLGAASYFQRQPQKLQLGLGVRGRINCPAEPDPPTTLIVWMKDGAGVIDTGEGGDEPPTGASESEQTPRASRWGETLSRPASAVDRGVKLAVPTTMTMSTTTAQKHQRDARLKTDEATGSLIVDPVTKADSGIYRCMAYSPLDNSRTTYQITVIVRGNALVAETRRSISCNCIFVRPPLAL